MDNYSKNPQVDAGWLEDLFDEALDLIQIVQLDGALLFVNDAWSRHLGYRKEEIHGRSIYSFINEPDRAIYKTYRDKVISGQIRDQPIVFRLQAKNGHLILVEGIVSVKHVQGKPQYTRGIFRDISLRIQYESQLLHLNKELKEREQNLEQLLLRAPDAVIVIDRYGKILFWNPRAEMLFGWKAEEVVTSDLSSTIIPSQHREAHAKGMTRYLATGEARVLDRTVEITALKKTGQEFYVALTISQTQQGGEVAFIAFIRDITDKKLNQLELERKTVLLEQSNARLEDFAYAASHDLKEPLRKMRIFTDRLKNSLKTHLNEVEANLIDRIEISAERMKHLVDDLLEFSHVSEQSRILEEVDLNERVQMVLSDLELLIEEKKGQILGSSLPTIKGNKRQVQQMFHNLIENALKYSKHGVPPIIKINSRIIYGSDADITVQTDDTERQFYLIEVSDNGIGFKKEYGSQIFEMFKRLHGKAEYAGSGIGLAIVQKVVNNLQGYIWATSVAGEGATFHIILPFNKG